MFAEKLKHKDVVITGRKSKKGQSIQWPIKKEQKENNDRGNTTLKNNIKKRKPTRKHREVKQFLTPLVAPVVILFNDMNIIWCLFFIGHNYALNKHKWEWWWTDHRFLSHGNRSWHHNTELKTWCNELYEPSLSKTLHFAIGFNSCLVIFLNSD